MEDDEKRATGVSKRAKLSEEEDEDALITSAAEALLEDSSNIS